MILDFAPEDKRRPPILAGDKLAYRVLAGASSFLTLAKNIS